MGFSGYHSIAACLKGKCFFQLACPEIVNGVSLSFIQRTAEVVIHFAMVPEV